MSNFLFRIQPRVSVFDDAVTFTGTVTVRDERGAEHTLNLWPQVWDGVTTLLQAARQGYGNALALSDFVQYLHDRLCEALNLPDEREDAQACRAFLYELAEELRQLAAQQIQQRRSA